MVPIPADPQKHGTYAVCVGSYRKVRRPCSCWMCGNPRRYSGAQTRQELKAALRIKD